MDNVLFSSFHNGKIQLFTTSGPGDNEENTSAIFYKSLSTYLFYYLCQDVYHDNYVVTCDPSILALGVLQLTLEIFGLQLPYLNTMESDRPWFKVFQFIESRQIFDLF